MICSEEIGGGMNHHKRCHCCFLTGRTEHSSPSPHAFAFAKKHWMLDKHRPSLVLDWMSKEEFSLSATFIWMIHDSNAFSRTPPVIQLQMYPVALNMLLPFDGSSLGDDDHQFA